MSIRTRTIESIRRRIAGTVGRERSDATAGSSALSTALAREEGTARLRTLLIALAAPAPDSTPRARSRNTISPRSAGAAALPADLGRRSSSPFAVASAVSLSRSDAGRAPAAPEGRAAPNLLPPDPTATDLTDHSKRSAVAVPTGKSRFDFPVIPSTPVNHPTKKVAFAVSGERQSTVSLNAAACRGVPVEIASSSRPRASADHPAYPNHPTQKGTK